MIILLIKITDNGKLNDRTTSFGAMHLSSTRTLYKATRVLSTKPGQKYMTSIDMDYLATAETNPILENSLGFGALTT